MSRDFLGDHALAQLAVAGVDTTSVTRHPTAGSGVSLVAVAPDGERSITYTNGANECFELEEISARCSAETRVLCVGSVFVLPQLTGEALRPPLSAGAVCRRDHRADVCWDAEGRGLPFLSPCLPHTDFFAPSREEGRQLTGCDQPAAIAAALLAAGAGAVGVKLGAEGCYLATADERWSVPTPPLDGVDTTGAGDTWLAGCVAGILSALPLERCGRARQPGCGVRGHGPRVLGARAAAGVAAGLGRAGGCVIR